MTAVRDSGLKRTRKLDGSLKAAGIGGRASAPLGARAANLAPAPHPGPTTSIRFTLGDPTMLAPLAAAAALSLVSPIGASPARPILVAENAAGEAQSGHGEATAPAAAHGHAGEKAASPRGSASGQNPTGAPNPATPWSGVGADGVSGPNQR